MNTETDFRTAQLACIASAREGVEAAERLPQTTEAEKARKDRRLAEAQRILKLRTE